MKWTVSYLPAAKEDLLRLDRSQQVQVLKAIDKVSQNPLPQTEGGLGKPLGSHSVANLTGYLKIKLRRQGLRVVYKLVRENDTMKIIVISVRDDQTVYRLAKERTQ